MDVPVKNFIGDSIVYDEINNVNIFNKHERSDKTLNELDKIPSTSKNDNTLNLELKSSVSNSHGIKYILGAQYDIVKLIWIDIFA